MKLLLSLVSVLFAVLYAMTNNCESLEGRKFVFYTGQADLHKSCNFEIVSYLLFFTFHTPIFVHNFLLKE